MMLIEPCLPLHEQVNGSLAASGLSSISLAHSASSESSIPTLLERIHAQRQREMMDPSSPVGGYPSPISDEGAASPTLGRVSMEFDQEHEMAEGLLVRQQSSTISDEDYSMQEYFLTFVLDMYTLFRSLPILGQIVMITVMIYLICVLI